MTLTPRQEPDKQAIAEELHRLERAAAVIRRRNANAAAPLIGAEPEAIITVAAVNYHLHHAETQLHELIERLAPETYKAAG